MSKARRWMSILATIVLLIAVAIGIAVATAWSVLPLDQATLVIDGETVALPNLSGWPAALLLLLAVLAVLVAAIVTVGGIAIAIAAAVFGIAVAAIAVVATVLLLTWPLLLIGWLIWRHARGPSTTGLRPEVA